VTTTSIDWKMVTRKLCEFHKEFKASIVCRDSNPIREGNLLNLTEEEEYFTQSGKEITPKKLRRWLWENRNARALTRDSLVLWSAYDHEKDVSIVGLGALVDDDIKQRFPPTHVVGVGDDSENGA
jgi:hypothetical protein